MAQLLVAREAVVKFFKRFEVFILPVLKFLLGLLVFSGITSIGYGANLPLVDTVSPGLLTFLFAVLFVVMPMNLSWIVIIITITAQFTSNMEVAIAVFIFLLLVFLFYARMATKESILIILMMLAFRFNIPYLIPIVAGLYFPVTAVIPVTVGVFIYAQTDGLFRIMQGTEVAAAAVAADAGDRDITEILGELPGAFSQVYELIVNSIASTEDWLYMAIIFILVIVLVHFVSRQAIDYSKEIAIGLGVVMTIFGLVIAVLFADATVNIGIAILSAVICGLIAVLIRFFDGILDYQRAESVQFEDDNNFYHVRIVPKVIMTKAQRSVKRIRPQQQQPANLPPDPFENPPDELPDGPEKDEPNVSR